MVVVRFAPSPTGALHVGGVRTALYNYLLAKKHHGKCILRIEDTDQTRFVEGAEQYIMDCLAWCGVVFDYSPQAGGPHVPYRQSERTDHYKSYTQLLVDTGNAYLAFDSPEELDLLRKEKEAQGSVFQYNYQTRKELKNSLTLSEDEVKRRIAAGESYVIRLKVPEDFTVVFEDEIRGEVQVHSQNIDDKVLMKSDGFPTYHLANVVDDHLMEITHVIRGEEWLPSAPTHCLLYRAFGWTPPKFAHLPLILRPDGNGKLAKRDGDRLGIPVFAMDWEGKNGDKAKGFKEAGYLPDALINFLALLGWNPGNDEEVMDMERMIALFSMDRVGKSGTKFDIDKLKWFNQIYIKAKSPEELLPFIKDYFIKHNPNAADFSDTYLKKVILLMKERVTLLPDFILHAPYMFSPPVYDAQLLNKKWNMTGKNALEGLRTTWSKEIEETNWNADSLQSIFAEYTQTHLIGNGNILPQLRLALTGVAGGPDSIAVAEVLGKKETLTRLNTLLNHPCQ